MASITGTNGADILTGTAGDDRIEALDSNDQVKGEGGADTIYGGAGNDMLYGGLGNDQLFGDAGNDYLYGGQGNDVLEGGDGDDNLSDDDSGSDTLRGGAGQDTISVSHGSSSIGVNETLVIDAGADNDTVRFYSYVNGSASIDLGTGNDRLDLSQNYYGNLTVTLGAGQDRVVLGSYFGSDYTSGTGSIAITDFAVGAAGDILGLNDYFGRTLLNWSGSNPLGTGGYLRTIQSGTDTLIQVDRDGAAGNSYNFRTLLTLQGVTATTLTTENFDGFNPAGTEALGRTIIGTNGADILTGTAGDDRIEALDSNDQVKGEGGADTIYGGAGNDMLYGGLGNDQLFGDAGNDYLYGGQGNDVLEGGDGDDSLSDDDSGSDTLRGGAGQDTISVSHGSSSIGVNETLVIDAGADDDTVRFYGYVKGTTSIDLGTGNDRLDLSQNYFGNLTVTLGAGQDRVVLGSYFGSDYIFGTDSTGITDFAFGATGDILDLNDYLAQKLLNWSGSNPFGTGGYLRAIQSGTDTLIQVDRDGAAGNSYSFRTLLTLQGVTASALTADNLNGFDPIGTAATGRTITGTNGADILTGTAGDDRIEALDSNDQVKGEGGADTIYGGAGNDMLYGGLGNDQLFGDAGNDYLYGGQGNDVLEGGDGDDSLSDDDSGSDTLRGGAGQDTISVSHGSSSIGVNETLVIDAGADNDTVRFYSYVNGSASIDLGTGNDRLDLSQNNYGNLTATLGAGQDRVVLGSYFGSDYSTTGSIVITDLTVGAGGDILDLNDHLGRTLLNWSGSNPFGTGGYLRAIQSGTDTLIQVDRDGAAGNSYNFRMLLTLQGVTASALTADNLNGFDPNGSSLPMDARNDFNGDGRSDILWRNNGGALSNWLGRKDGGFMTNDPNAFTQVPTSWQVAATADLNGDGRDDILWRHADGTIANWLARADGGFTPNDSNGLVRVGTDWQVTGTGDFNGDGRDDILWRHVGGMMSNWLSTSAGSYSANDAAAASNVSMEWKVAGIGDFNGDGRDDILWRHNDGSFSDWLGRTNGGFATNDAAAFGRVGTEWSIVGTGDFNGDGRDDILWRHADGSLSNWLGRTDGGFAANDGAAFVAKVPTNWSVIDTGDYNGDGRDDILWRSDTGILSNWLANAAGGFVTNDVVALVEVATDWHMA